ncbi:MAG: LCP family protein [Anaerovoracaceae bacterium]
MKGRTIGAQTNTEASYAEARKQLKKKVDVEFEYVSELPALMDSLLEGERPAVFISAASYESMTGQDSSLENKTRVIERISVKVESRSTTNHVKVTKEPFNILVSGLDTTGDIDVVSRSDVNMIVTVNPNTHQILLTSIPRDYYVELASKGAKDKLTHSGIYGISETVATVEKFIWYIAHYKSKLQHIDKTGGRNWRNRHQLTVFFQHTRHAGQIYFPGRI